MSHHKKGRAKNQRAGCLMCKYWKVNGSGYKSDGRYSSKRKRKVMSDEIKNYKSIKG